MSENVEPQKKPQSEPDSEQNKTNIVFHIFDDIKDSNMRNVAIWLLTLIAGILSAKYIEEIKIPYICIFVISFVTLTLTYFFSKHIKRKVALWLSSIFINIFIGLCILNYTTNIFTPNPQKQPMIETTNTDSPKTTDTLKPNTAADTSKTQRPNLPCKPEYTVKFNYGKPNRTILIFDSTECTGKVIYSGVTGSDGCCSITFKTDCNLPHYVRVSCEAPSEYLKSICTYILPDKWPLSKKYPVKECVLLK